MDEPCPAVNRLEPDADEIIGGYRFILGEHVKIDDNGQPILATGSFIPFSNQFIKEYLPIMLELYPIFVRIRISIVAGRSKKVFLRSITYWDGLRSSFH